MCDDFGYNVQVVQNARTLLKNLRKAEEGFQKIFSRAPKYNFKVLKKIVSFCQKNSLTAMPNYPRGNFLLQKLKKAREIMNAAYDAVEEEPLIKAIDYANQPNFDGTKYKCQLLNDCKDLLKRIQKITKEAKLAIQQCIEDQVRTVVGAADDIRMNTKPIRKLRKLVNGPYSTFLNEQFKCAKQCKDDMRAVRVSVLKKNLEVEDDTGNVFAAKKFHDLKDPMKWANEKWFGNKVTIAEKMLKFQKATIHSPLTKRSVSSDDKTHLRLLRKYSLNNFDTVQKYMGQRNTTHMPQRLEELLQRSATFEELRDEVYLAIIKQCTDNPGLNDPKHGDAIARAFELLALCLTTFPPSEAFQDYLESFVRRDEYKQYADKFNHPFLISRICYWCR